MVSFSLFCCTVKFVASFSPWLCVSVANERLPTLYFIFSVVQMERRVECDRLRDRIDAQQRVNTKVQRAFHLTRGLDRDSHIRKAWLEVSYRLHDHPAQARLIGGTLDIGLTKVREAIDQNRFLEFFQVVWNLVDALARVEQPLEVAPDSLLELAQAAGARSRGLSRDVQFTIDQSVQHGGGYADFGVGSWHCFHHEDAKAQRIAKKSCVKEQTTQESRSGKSLLATLRVFAS